MPKICENGQFQLALMREGFVDSLRAWAEWRADLTDKDKGQRAAMCGLLCVGEGLCTPREAITDAEAKALDNIVTEMEMVAGWDAKMAKAMDADEGLKKYCKDHDQAIGWSYLKRAFATNGGQTPMPIVIPTYKGLKDAKLSEMEYRQSCSEVGAAFEKAYTDAELNRKANPDGYDAVILPDPEPGMTVNEYQTAQQKIWDNDGTSVATTSGAAGGGTFQTDPTAAPSIGDPGSNDPSRDPSTNDPSRGDPATGAHVGI